VIKPIAAAASMGVVRVDNLQELKHKVVVTQKQLESLYLDEHVSTGEEAFTTFYCWALLTTQDEYV
jgi:biotin carboxylase